ncbi:MAG: DUF4038 domain-containing protein, partial [Armatimonadetes bacterium]|nr:DUF4038 domain-containing protein [Armatimonadota bacterium]
EADLYLSNRAAKGFTVIQAVVLAELAGLTEPNANGDLPLVDLDLARPNAAYFAHVDYIVESARAKGLYIGMLPTWGDKVVKAWGLGPDGFIHAGNAAGWGRFLGERYADAPNLIWILGGDRTAEGVEGVWREMARGLREGDGGAHLMTYHPWGGHSSSAWLHGEEWLDFNMLQSGHGEKNGPNYRMIEHDYALAPTKPCLDGEPRYEDHPVGWKPEELGWFDDFDVRQAAYWALFAGAHGHTYGCHDVWQFYQPGRQPVSWARTPWQEALDLPGAFDMQHVRALIESRPMLLRLPDQALIVGDPGEGLDHLQATRASDGSYAFVYLPTGRPVTVRLSRLAGELRASWFDPRTGASQAIGLYPNTTDRTFTPPSSGRGHDWVLVLDEAARRFPIPGP